MAFSPVASNGGRRSRGVTPLAEINVTPFVDVALVLLIIFMITAHITDYGIDVDVPKTRSVATTTKDLPVVLVSKDGDIYLGKDPVKLLLLPQQIRAKYPGQSAVYLRASAQATFDIVANVMSVLGDAKLRVQVVTQPSDNTSRKR